MERTSEILVDCTTCHARFFVNTDNETPRQSGWTCGGCVRKVESIELLDEAIGNAIDCVETLRDALLGAREAMKILSGL